MANVLDHDIVVSGLEFSRANTFTFGLRPFGKVRTPLSLPPATGYTVQLLFFYKVRVSLGAPFIRPCATSKQRAF